jgi:TPR repeat protein
MKWAIAAVGAVIVFLVARMIPRWARQSRDHVHRRAQFTAYSLAAGQGNAEAMCNIGGCYQYGRGVVRQFAGAKHWYEQAAAQGHAFAMFGLGTLYEEERHRDLQEAIEWHTKAAELGNKGAMYHLASLYRDADPAAADNWFERAGGDHAENISIDMMWSTFGLDGPDGDIDSVPS